MSHFMRPRQQIDEGLAMSFAGQIAAGLTPGAGECDRMFAALTAIGLMLKNATDAQVVHDTLDLIETSTVTAHGDGHTEYVVRLGPDKPS